MESHPTQEDVLSEDMTESAVVGRRSGGDRRDTSDRRRHRGRLYRARLPDEDDRRRQDRRDTVLSSWLQWLTPRRR